MPIESEQLRTPNPENKTCWQALLNRLIMEGCRIPAEVVCLKSWRVASKLLNILLSS